jgi:dolichol-phosphate mannosyltransferase
VREEKLTVILPTKNEVVALPWVVSELRGQLPDFKALIADGLSNDGTPALAESLGLKVIKVEKKGVGSAFIEALIHIDTPFILLIDADYTYEIDEFIHIALKDMEISNLDLIIGNRKYKDWKAMSFLHRLGNFFLSLEASLLYGFRVKDVCTGFWLFRTSTLKTFNIKSQGFTLVEDLFINSIKRHCKISILNISYRSRLDGSRAKITYSDGLRLAWFLLKERF